MQQMPLARMSRLREAAAGTPSLSQIGVVGLAVLLAFAIFVVSLSVERFEVSAHIVPCEGWPRREVISPKRCRR